MTSHPVSRARLSSQVAAAPSVAQPGASQLTRRQILAFAAAGAATAAIPAFTIRNASAQAAAPEKIRLDYAYYNPSSLVLRRQGWLEADLSAEGIAVEWTLSAGSNKANEFLRSDAVDFGSTAGSAALLAKANGSEIQAVYIYSQPEWTALVVTADSEITTIEGLKGKKVAATSGTDPFFFLLQALNSVGLSQSDVSIVNIQHADGKTALERGDVDAWSGLDPHMAQTELESGSKLIYRNIDFNTYGFLNARIGFIEQYPTFVERVLTQYERARAWIGENPDETAKILSEEASLSIEVANKELVERTNLDIDVVPGDAQRAALEPVIPILESENQLQPGSDVNAALDGLFAPQFATAVTGQ
ncbi:MAG: aliphatic sulfonate ABC transporter substrate-binding protein [Chloroflexota bacterium]|nr:aliphatic sulfonate ABC transporter substrate-binding protein [Chloroflexota bacterium]